MAQQYFRVAGLEITAAEIDWPLDGVIQLTWQPPTLARRVDHYALFHGESGVFLDPTTVQVGSVAAGPTPSFNYAAPTDGSDHFIWIIAFEDAAQNYGGSNRAMFGCQNNNFPAGGVSKGSAASPPFNPPDANVTPFTSNIANFNGAFRTNMTGSVIGSISPAAEINLQIMYQQPSAPLDQTLQLINLTAPTAFNVSNEIDLDNTLQQGQPVFVGISPLQGGTPGTQETTTSMIAKVSYFAPAQAVATFFVPNEGDEAGAPFGSLILNPPPAIALPCVPYCNSTCALAMWPV